MTKILILSAKLTNKGGYALVITTIEAIRKFIPDAEFVLMGPREVSEGGFLVKKQVAQVAFRAHVRPYRLLFSLLYLIECALIYVGRRLGIGMPIFKNSKLADYYQSDLVINSGGDRLSGEGSFGLTSFMNIMYAILLDKPVILYGESLGYYSNPIFNAIAKFVLNRTTLILVREELSKKYLDTQGITKPKIYVTADPAFLLPAAPEERVYKILRHEGMIQIQRPLIGINASGKIMKDDNKIEVFARAIDDLVENLNATILMIPHVYTSGVDDRVTIESILSKIRNKSKVGIIRNEYTPQELKGIIGQCDLFIGARMHATIASTSMLVPTIGIAYSHKMHGMLGNMLGQGRYILDVEELDCESLKSKIWDVWQNRQGVRAELARRIPQVKEKAMLNGKLVKELLDLLRMS